ncbi:SDR family oxidoreductase [Ktedonospora formicarum]|uniref:Short-chain dehydrogenase n=1 Tax=Ktedonospora formicarum TaxID=2778364 RepID=A0A8J3IE36_9CHLR|nr:SDR family oxidoreductase [Ktedonospora formicarum]GHO49614.1 short-chain dehydrogenase [Ktedonospora formicarum]
MNLSGQRVIILGGASGVGLATAKSLVTQGANVIIGGRQAEKVKQAVAEVGEGASGEAVDAADSEQLRTFFQRVGKFDHLVLTLSGGAGAGPLRTLEMDALGKGFEGKFWPQIRAAQASLETIRRDGSITFVTAISARNSMPGTAGLAAINGALEAMVPPLASELRPLRVNAVSPGIIATPWWNIMPEKQRVAFFKESAAATSVGRVGEPEDVALSIVYLIQNGFVTGSVLECDGGLRLDNSVQL